MPAISGRPIGQVIRSTVASSWPSASRFFRNVAHFALDPISPTLPHLPEVGEAEGGVAEGEVLGVVVGHDQHVGAGGQPLQHQLPQHRPVHLDVGGPGGHVGQPELVELLGPGVDQVQPDLQPGQDPGQLEADVPDAEDRHRRPHREGFQQQPDLAAAALPAVLVARRAG